MANHVFCHSEIDVVLAIVDLKPQSDEAREDGRCTRLCADWRRSFAWFDSRNGQAKPLITTLSNLESTCHTEVSLALD
jgi:hypothetical protein